MLGVGRQVSAFKLMDRPTQTKAVAFGILLAATLLLAALTWNGPASLFPVVGSLIASYAMLHMRGAALRWAMVLVSSLWMGNAIAFDSWWQMTANGWAGGAAAIGGLAYAFDRHGGERLRRMWPAMRMQRAMRLLCRDDKRKRSVNDALAWR